MPPTKAAEEQLEEQVAEETPVEEAEVGAYSDLTKEKKSSYVAALKREKDGYGARIKQLKAVGDDDQVKIIEGRAKQVEAELKKVARVKVVEDTVDEEA